ncbi:hypothetical protein K469DRAFT_767383 [Zopfia rhizophila CBS 207.26]|uniref:Nephrocystin 3-like N-terminal domain-containing protein n=1 Tax=Zopfia rhizophila CBS 207.26 TaxID=1314779 RepID=A0A6A6E9L7_9PEZI|nr:hypothetical protein K469DRAFT_767383 [Zopfia rhizophila CBS 207.26]
MTDRRKRGSTRGISNEAVRLYEVARLPIRFCQHAIVDISAKIASLCFQYSVAVNNSKKDIDRLQRTVTNIKNVLEEVRQLLDGQDKTRLLTTHKDSLEECYQQLQGLKAQLEPGKTRKAMHRFGVRALKWPFTNKQVENMVASLEKCEQTFSLALQVDQTGLILSVGRKLSLVDKKTDNLLSKIDVVELPIAKGASFDSHMEEHNTKCLPNTRTELQHHIMEWAKGRNGKPIFWLNGASFFFKRGEGERGNATRFFTTIATDLMGHVPGLISGIRKAINAEPAISEKALKDQFKKLILQPLSETEPVKALDLTIVIDALDECERDEEHELGEIRTQRSLSLDWPAKDQIQSLVEIAIPLFIFAATVCRYIGGKGGYPKERLDIVL